MKVSDILRVKGNTLYTVTPDEPLGARHRDHGRKGHRFAGRDGAWRPGGHAHFPRSDRAIVKNGGGVGATHGAHARWTTTR